MPKELFFTLPAEKQERITKAALAEFLAHQDEYEKASVKRIAAGAGIAVGSIYQYFEGKDDIFFHVLDAVRPPATHEPGAGTLADMINAYWGEHFGKKDAYNALVDIGIRNQKTLLYSLTFEYSPPDITRLIEEFLEEDRANGLLREGLDIGQAAFMFLTLDFLTYTYSNGKGYPKETLAEVNKRFMDIFFRGIYK